MPFLSFKSLLIVCAVFMVCLVLRAQEDTRGLKVQDEQIEQIKKTRDIKALDTYAVSKRWAVVIGVNEYEDKYISDLKKAQNDAKVLADVLTHEGQFDHVFTFTDDTYRESETYPSLNNVIAKLEYLKDEIHPDDTLIFTFSGHGISDDDGRSYLLLADSKISEPYKTSLPLFEIQDWLTDLNIKKNIVILDACRNVVEKTKGVNIKTLLSEKNSQAEVSAVVYATSPGEFSYEHDKEPYGVFTTFLIDGLKGDADHNDDVMITFNELRQYVEEGVNQWSMDHNKKQKPYTSIKGEFHGDVILSVIPLHARSKYNPNLITTSYQKQRLAYRSLNYSGLAVMITSFTGAATGLALGIAGYYQYAGLRLDSDPADFDLYWYMKDAGFYCAMGFGGLALAAIIPFAVSFSIRPDKKKRFGTSSLHIDYSRNNLSVYAVIRPGKGGWHHD